jgi:aminoglycoside phosphotransferase (APT) family kinase protein
LEKFTQEQIEKLVQKVAPQGELVRAWPLTGGISAQMTALEIERADGQTQRLIVRRPGEGTLRHNPRAVDDEFTLLQQARTLGLPVPDAVFLDASGAILPAPYLVIEYIDGRPEFMPADLENYTHQLAGHLAAIHRAGASGLDFSFLPIPAEDFPARPLSAAPWFEVDRIRAVLEPAWPIPQRNPSTLLHGDYWPGNILWRGDQLAAVIDWEDADFGDPLVDLAVSRLDLLWIFGREAMTSFTRHYLASLAVDTTQLPYWDLYAALRLARLAGPDMEGWTAFFIPFGRADITYETIREHYQYFIEQAFQKLEAE